MRKIELIPYAQGKHFRAVFGPLEPAGEAWAIRRYAEGDKEILEAVVIFPKEDVARTYRFKHDGTNWITTSEPIAKLSLTELFV